MKLTIRCVINWDLQLVNLPEFFTLEIVIQEDVDGICEVRAMERNTDEEEPDVEGGLAFGEGDFALIEVRGSANLAESGNETIESTRGTSDDECLDAVVEGDAKLGVVWKVFVGRSDVTLQVLEI